MAGFFEHGVYLQQHAVSVREANRKYATSCNICCNRGFRVDCDRCPIAVSNKQTVEVLHGLHAGQKTAQKGAVVCRM